MNVVPVKVIEHAVQQLVCMLPFASVPLKHSESTPQLPLVDRMSMAGIAKHAAIKSAATATRVRDVASRGTRKDRRARDAVVRSELRSSRATVGNGCP